MGAQSGKRMQAMCFGVVTGLCLMLGSATVDAMSLGEIEVHSRLGEPLKATIPVSATQAELDELEVMMADQQAFKRLGIDRSVVIEGLQISLVKKSDKPHIQVTSTALVKEPLFEFVLSAHWGNSRMTRPFAVFLSP